MPARPIPEVMEHVDDEAFYPPREVVLVLGIDGSTLRLRSREFAELFNPAATRSPTADSAPGRQRYTAADLEVLDPGLRYHGTDVACITRPA